MRARRNATFDGVDYNVGRRFRVTYPNARLTGLQPQMGYYSGWQQTLEVGDIIICTGFGAGFGGDPGYGVEWETEKSREAGAISIMFNPMTGGAFAYRPFPGLIEPVEEE